MKLTEDMGLHVIQFPSGKFGFVGSVPKELVITHADGSPLSSSEWDEYKKASNPGMIQKSKGYKQPTFSSAKEATEYAKKAGFDVQENMAQKVLALIEVQEWGVEWFEFNKKGEQIRKQKIFDSQKKRDDFAAKLEQSDGFHEFIAWLDPKIADKA